MNQIPGRQDPPPSHHSHHSRIDTQVRGHHRQSPTNTGPPPGPPGQEYRTQFRELKVEDALMYLDEVKQQFGDKPGIYNQFLDVMKNFKAQTIDTPGVIQRVSTLFKGYPKLILGFNTFLPPGYKIKPEGYDTIPSQTELDSSKSITPRYEVPPATTNPPTVSYPPIQSIQQPPIPSSTIISGNPVQPTITNPKRPQASGRRSYVQVRPGENTGSRQPVEFDHAISYVTTIKKRFCNEPETYKAFLEILHNYQKEQRSIKQVLEQVSHLFRDHPDLLREFTYFLPDAVQEQAKERLNRAADKAMQRKADKGSNDKGPKQTSNSIGHGIPISTMDKKLGDKSVVSVKSSEHDSRKKSDKMRNHMKDLQAKKMEFARRSKLERETERKDRERERQKLRYQEKKNKKKIYDDKERRDRFAFDETTVLPSEWRFFEKVKKVLPSRDCWREFLKCLDLYSQEVLGRQEMLSLVRNLFGRRNDIVEEFTKLLDEHGMKDDRSDVWFSMPLAEIDFSRCRRCTPSYRALPSSYPNPPCSVRSELEKSVCNDSWVSVPTGSEDFSFKNMRKNQYEEALFKCEDERFEIDMIIDSNASTIRILEPLAEEIENLKKAADSNEQQWQYCIDKRTLGTIHLNAISRIYGEHGNEVLELLRKHPAGAIPVILKRLKQKDEEWRRARQDLNKQWKEVNDKNFHKSLDHCSFYFKQQDKKQISTRGLVSEAKAKFDAAEKNVVGSSDNPATTDSNDGKSLDEKKNSKENDDWKSHFTFEFACPSVHKDVYAVLAYAVEHNLPSSDKERIGRLWKDFLLVFFNLPIEWVEGTARKVTTPANKADALKAGTDVRTPFGVGSVISFVEASATYLVDVPSVGRCYVQPGSISVIDDSGKYPPNLPLSDDEKQPNFSNVVVSPGSHTMYGSQAMYIFLRLYQKLYHRLQRARELCEKAKRNRKKITINPAARALAHCHHIEDRKKEQAGDYQAFLTTLYTLIDGSIDNARYEDCCRNLMGSSSFLLFTLDKLVNHILKQLQNLVTDETCTNLQDIFLEIRKEPGNVTLASYLDKTTSIFEGEDAYRIFFDSGVLRRSPKYESPTPHPSTPVEDKSAGKIWAPSPRIHQIPVNTWIREPKLMIEFLGSVDEEEEEDEEDVENNMETPNQSPVETPIVSPSPEDISENQEGDEMDIDNADNAKSEEPNVTKPTDDNTKDTDDIAQKKRKREETVEEHVPRTRRSKGVKDKEEIFSKKEKLVSPKSSSTTDSKIMMKEEVANGERTE